MDKEQTISSKLDELDRKIDTVNREISAVENKIDGLRAPSKSSSRNDLFIFMRAASKTIKTFYDEVQFQKKRKLALYSLLITLGTLLLEQFLSSAYFGLYSTFSFITAIAGLYLAFKMFKISSFSEEMGYDDLVKAGIGYYGFDEQMLPTTNGRMKKLYNWMTVIGISGAFLNFLGLFVMTPAFSGLLGLCIFLEFLTIALLLVSFFLVREFATSYFMILFKKDDVTLAADIISKRIERVK